MTSTSDQIFVGILDIGIPFIYFLMLVLSHQPLIDRWKIDVLIDEPFVWQLCKLYLTVVWVGVLSKGEK